MEFTLPRQREKPQVARCMRGTNAAKLATEFREMITLRSNCRTTYCGKL